MVGQARRRRLDQRGAAGIGAFARKGLAGGSHIVIHMYNKDRFMATLRDTFDTIDPLPADSLDGWSLPAWTYSDPDFHAVEMERIFRPSRKAVCPGSDIPNARKRVVEGKSVYERVDLGGARNIKKKKK